MEYDNDRLRRRTDKTEIFYWGLFVLIYPLINISTLFLRDPRIWPVLLFISLLLFPGYLLYSRIMGSVFLTQHRRGFAILMTILSFLVIQAFLFAVHFLILKFNLSPWERAYFSFSPLPS